ncbi:MAG: hypothetical protein KC708_21520 [Anaerolineae bacterium]|nr:hypothetical protein [Anaerolineae bacterium]
MASTKEKMQKARELIQAKKYIEARAILRTIDHDKAYEWLDRIDEVLSSNQSAVFGTSTQNTRTQDNISASKPDRENATSEQENENNTESSCLRTTLLIIVGALVFFIILQPRTDDVRVPSSDQAIVDQVADSVSVWAGGRNVEQVRYLDASDNDGERGIFITYLTQESTEAGIVDEWIDLFEAVGTSVGAHDLDIDSVVLIMQSSSGRDLGVIIADVIDIRLYQRGTLTRGRFLDTLDISGL